MKNYKKLDLRKVINFDSDIFVDEYNYDILYKLYSLYYKHKDTILTYKGIDLKEYAKSHKTRKGGSEEEPWEVLVNKEIKRVEKMVGKTRLIAWIIVLEGMAGIFNHYTHNDINIDNSKYILENCFSDTNGDGIKEIHLDEASSYNNYKQPTSDGLYAITNPIYYLSEYNKISNGYSIHEATKELNIDVIEFNNEYYTYTGKLSFITCNINGSKYLFNLPYEFESKEKAREVTEYFLNIDPKVDYYDNIDYIGTINVNTFEDLPSFYQSKKDGSIKTKEQNKILKYINKKIQD